MASLCLVVTSLLVFIFFTDTLFFSPHLFILPFTVSTCMYLLCSSVLFFSLLLSSSSHIPPSLFSCFISFHQIQCYLIFRQWHWDLPPGSCSSAPYRALFLERSAAHSWSICVQLVCLWCPDEATGTKRKSKVSSWVFWCMLLGYKRNMLF